MLSLVPFIFQLPPTKNFLLPLPSADKAATPGRTFPSKSSKLAPPPVLTWLTLSSVPYLAQQVAVSPPPMMVQPPAEVNLTTPAIRDTLLYCGSSDCCILSKFVCSHKVNREVQLNVLGLGFLHQFGYNLCSFFIIQRCSNVHVVIDFPEGESHSTSYNHFIYFVQHIFNQLNLVCNLCSSKDGQEGFLWVVESLGKVCQLLLEQESRSTSFKTFTHHAGVSSVSSSKSIIDINICKFSQ